MKVSSSSPAAANPQDGGGKKTQLEKAAQDFESVFLNLVFQSMRSTVEKSGYVDGGNGEDIYRSLLDQEYAKTMSSQSMTGLSQAIVKQWEKYL
jgi:flagellar protein FlgJ